MKRIDTVLPPSYPRAQLRSTGREGEMENRKFTKSVYDIYYTMFSHDKIPADLVVPRIMASYINRILEPVHVQSPTDVRAR